MSETPSKIIHISAAGNNNDIEIYALDDEGIVWLRNWSEKCWIKVNKETDPWSVQQSYES